MSRRPVVLVAASLAGAALLLGGCRSDASAPQAAPSGPATTVAAPLPAPRADRPTDYPGLHNLVLFGDGLVSGSQPDGAAGFASLKALGFRTIVSVDGAEPDVAAASAEGLRYVHLPIGYNGMTAERQAEIARAVRDLPGPVYVHCHHGKHRSAAAAAGAAMLLGKADKEQALAGMKVAGTAPSYTGLWACVDLALAQPAGAVDHATAEFPTVSRPKGLAKSMIAIDEAFEHLKLVQANGWAVPTNHPDLVPAADAGTIADLYRIAGGDATLLAKHDPGFGQALRDANLRAVALEEAIARGASTKELDPLFQAAKNDCTACHAAHRDRETPE